MTWKVAGKGKAEQSPVSFGIRIFFFLNEDGKCFLVLKIFCLLASIFFFFKLMHCCYLGNV